MTALTIRLKKQTDSSVVLTCVRGDGTTSWQRNEGANARFFPGHDLTHLAAESVLRVENAFYGLVARGWDIADFGSPWPRGPLPPVAADMELVVGFLDSERLAGERSTASDLHDRSALQYASRGATPPADAWSMRIQDAQLEAIRARRDELLARWGAIPSGGMLEESFGW